MAEISTQEHVLFDFEVTEAVYLKLWDFSLFRSQNYKLKKRVILTLYIFLSPSFLIFNLVYYGLIYGNYLYLLDIFDWMTAFIPLLFGAFFLYTFLFKGKRIYRKLPIQHQHLNYDFGPDGFTISSVTPLSQSQSDLRYDVIQKAYETTDAFYLYPTKNTAHIVEKSGLIQGNITTLRLNLQKALKKKYILCK